MAEWQIQDEGPLLKNSALQLLVGECLGVGASRHVYALPHDDSLVLKVEHSGRTFHNQMEWNLWQEVKDYPISDWFSPCIDIDGYGNVLIQRRTESFEDRKAFEAALRRTRGGFIPGVFDDVHWGNFGMLDGRVTCHDYGYHLFFQKIARDLSIEAGYFKEGDAADDGEKFTNYDYTEGGQLVLDL